MAKTQNHMNLLQLCQPFHLYKNSVVDKYRKIKTCGAQKKENLHQELEEERFEKFPKLHWLIRIYGNEGLCLKIKLTVTLVIDSCHVLQWYNRVKS
jgi:hypothetical protein